LKDYVAIPSRLHHCHGSIRPLSGLRIAVKDNFRLAGVKMSLCSNSYHELYPASSETALCIQSLINAGAAVLGSTRMASFAATEEPVDCVDFQAPWNPRADGYQSPAGSSSGSGVAIASYDWLDIALGSDSELTCSKSFLISRNMRASKWQWQKTGTLERMLCNAPLARRSTSGRVQYQLSVRSAPGQTTYIG